VRRTNGYILLTEAISTVGLLENGQRMLIVSLRDITAQMGTADFWRLRLGIGHPRDSAIPQQPVVDYVLRPPLAEERKAIEDAISRGLDAWPAMADGNFERAMLDLHTRKGTS
jgi:PTH1 family peptidyl-tRNA hydrolase